jgi:signal transduction histidine kinase
MNTNFINVLLVEDDEYDVVITRHLLSQAGTQNFHVQAAGRLSKAFELIANTPPDVILLDISLPDSQGKQTLEQTLQQAKQIPVILLTGSSDEALGIQAVQDGAQDYLLKGHIDRDRLARAIHYAIERKRSELELKAYRDHLEDMVNEQTKELREANAQLQANDRARTEFVSNVSHELKTPLASMNYAINNLLKGIAGPLPERVITYIEMLNEDAQRLGNTIGDILDLSRIEAHSLQLDRVRIPLSRLVQRTVDSLLLQASENNISLNLSMNGCAAFAECDPKQIERVILNIIRNAIKFTPDNGSIDVSLATATENQNYFHISITDSGIGIKPEHIEKVTDRYFRVGEQVDGTGLGLAICKEIVELHGGSMTLSSPPQNRPHGTQVDVRLPKSTPPRVLAVNNCSLTTDLIKVQLNNHGYTVNCCQDGSEAITKIESLNPDIIITDLVMPVLDGVAMIAEIKARPAWRHIPIIAVTVGELDITKREILEGFSIPTLAKPWKQRELLDLIESSVFGMQYLNASSSQTGDQ